MKNITKKISASLLMLAMAVTISCAQVKDKDGFITTASGLKYKVTLATKAEMPKANDKVSVHYTGKLTNDTVFDSSIKRGQPFSFPLGKGNVIKGWDEGIALLHKGEKATFIIPSELGYGAQSMGKIPANATLIFDVELVDIIPGVSAVPYDVKGKDTLKTASGLKYIMVVKNPTTPQAQSGKQVTVHYTGYLTNGSKFDSSIERGQPIPFMLGSGQVIKGWDEGIALLHVGEKARLVIPYTLAYGEAGRPPIIPAKSDLIFDVELVGVQ